MRGRSVWLSDEMKYIANFSKNDRMVYISHLDLQRMLLRVMRMAGIRLAYSEGFNPHAKFSIALPLSLGFSSIDEYFEFETTEAVEIAAIMQKLNTILPSGIRIKSICPKPAELKKSLAALVSGVKYEIMAVCAQGGNNPISLKDILSVDKAVIAPIKIWGNKVIFSM